MELREVLILIGSAMGLVGASFLLFQLLRKPTLRVEVARAVGETRDGPRLCYHLNLRLTAFGAPCSLQRVKLSHPRVPDTTLVVNYAMGEYATRDLLELEDAVFQIRTKHSLDPAKHDLPPSIRLPGLQLARGKPIEITLAGHIPFILSNRQRDLIPVEGWELEIKSSIGTETLVVFEPFRPR